MSGTASFQVDLDSLGSPIRTILGSAKNVHVYKDGTMEFDPHNGFSVFDYVNREAGYEMPQVIPYKGAAMRASIIENDRVLKAAGIETSLHIKNGRIFSQQFSIPDGYKPMDKEADNTMLNAEVILRDFCHPASSDLGRIRSGKKTWEELGYLEEPLPNAELPETKMSFSTKFQTTDVYAGQQEILGDLCGLDEDQQSVLIKTAKVAFRSITNYYKKFGLLHYDGKIEFAKCDGKFVVVDVVGTPDEDRFGLPVVDLDGTKQYAEWSKQFGRNLLTWMDWKKETKIAKDVAAHNGEKNWQQYCTSTPPKLDPFAIQVWSQLYLSNAMEFCKSSIIASGLSHYREQPDGKTRELGIWGATKVGAAMLGIEAGFRQARPETFG
jgi:phosphoribosylaminoimidazole-succinocarboxamide synthase